MPENRFSFHSADQSSKGPGVLSLGAFAVAFIGAVCFLPLLIGTRQAVSESYVYGFNNHVALAAILCGAFAFAWWARNWDIRFPETRPEIAPWPRGLLFSVLILTVLFTSFIWIANRSGGAFDDAVYALTRMHEYLRGAELYRQIEYCYGPLLFFIPVWASRLFHVTPESAYFLTWILEWFVGIPLLWATIHLALPARYARPTFIGFSLFYLLTLAVTGGQSYTPVRFMLGPFTALLSYELYRQRRSPLSYFGIAAAGTAFTLLLSPEQGVALFFATSIFFLLCTNRRTSAFGFVYAGYIASGITVVYLLWRMGAFNTALALGHGELNMPVLLCPQQVCIFAFLLIGAAAVNRARLDRRLDDPLVYLCAISLFLLPSAYGRCDIEHVILGTTPALIAAVAALSRYEKAWRMARAAFFWAVLIPTILLQLTATRSLFLHAVKPAVYSKAGEASALYRLEPYVFGKAGKQTWWEARMPSSRRNAVASLPDDLDVVYYAPFSYQPPVAASQAFPVVTTGEFNGVENVVNSGQIERKISEIKVHPERPLLLSTNWQRHCTLDDGAYDVLMTILFTPAYIPPERNTIKTFQPLCDYIRQNYTQTSKQSWFPTYRIWYRLPEQQDRISGLRQ